ncbi:FKBP-type peptidyl-prolyl cis-trans isomerase [Plantibacter sp. YIM 135347]|uniref:FKBP-type peptidyl-prolyl cis-trans isomerase n=1 Tax=Plantibacter sp. YIM 135347 TaxID=3423919 RepID=UPI003D32C0A0
MRTAPAIIATAGLLLVTLTGCSPAGAANCSDAAEAGAATKLVHVTGAEGEQPKVEVPSPIYTKTTERDIVSEGTGAPLSEDQTAMVNFVLINGTTGETIGSSDFSKPGSLALNLKSGSKGFRDALVCAPVGSRVTAVIPATKAFAEAEASQLGLTKSDSIVLVADISNALLGRANGAERPTPSGFPTVVTAPDGRPGVTVPSAEPPTTVKTAVIKQGDGATVKKGDNVTVAYTGVLWKEKSVFQSTWEDGKPLSYKAGELGIKGFDNAIIGQKVGSQVIVVLPPKDAYGDQGSGPVPANATLIFVVDILGVSPAS